MYIFLFFLLFQNFRFHYEKLILKPKVIQSSLILNNAALGSFLLNAAFACALRLTSSLTTEADPSAPSAWRPVLMCTRPWWSSISLVQSLWPNRCCLTWHREAEGASWPSAVWLVLLEHPWQLDTPPANMLFRFMSAAFFSTQTFFQTLFGFNLWWGANIAFIYIWFRNEKMFSSNQCLWCCLYTGFLQLPSNWAHRLS